MASRSAGGKDMVGAGMILLGGIMGSGKGEIGGGAGGWVRRFRQYEGLSRKD